MCAAESGSVTAAESVGAATPSYNDMVVKAAALALREFPRANGSYKDGRFELYSRVNIGVAVAAHDALVVPTVFDADKKSLGEIARDEVDVTRAVHMVPEEDPKQEAPRDDGGEKALDGAIAAAFARPAGHAEHGDASGHHQERAHYPAALAQSGCRYVGLKALQKCYNVHRGLPVGLALSLW